MKTRHVRYNRRVDNFSRGMELIKAILTMWKKNEKCRYKEDGNRIIEQRIIALAAEFDLTKDEWFYWADIAMESAKRNG